MMVSYARCLLVLVLLSIYYERSSAITLDVHLELGQETFWQDLNLKIHKLLPYDDIDFATTALPHVTLYMTDFRNDSTHIIYNKTRDIVRNIQQQCLVQLEGVTVQGQYAMWDVKVIPCLQEMSNSLVVALQPYITPNQPIPDWVLQLPEPMRSEKITLIKTYGSPNVFGQFQAHVTLAWDDKDDMGPAFKVLNLQPKSVIPTQVGIGQVGPHGSVIRGKNLGTFSLP